MQEPKDTLTFGRQETPRFGSYAAPSSAKAAPPQRELVVSVPSLILASPAVQQAYQSFGLEGLKSIFLQELVALDFAGIAAELKLLAAGAQENQVIKRALRATKLLAAQWLEDPRRQADVREKCQLIFETIPTFATANLRTRQDLMAQAQLPAHPPYPPVPTDVPVESEHPFAPGSSIIYLTDVQGHFAQLEMLLQTCQLAERRGSWLHWCAPEHIYFVLVGDLVNKSPYSAWGNQAGFDSFKVLETVRRLVEESRGRVLLSFGSYDLEIATKAAFYHPLTGFMGRVGGVNAQAQALPLVISFIKGTAFESEGHPYSAWERWISPQGQLAFRLRETYRVHGEPALVVPVDAEGQPDVSFLLDFYQRLFAFVVPSSAGDRPAAIEQIDARAAQLLPPVTPELDLSALASSAGRRAHVEGLLEGSGTLEFLRRGVGGLHIFKTPQRELFAAHFDMQEQTLDMLDAFKQTENWELPELEDYCELSPALAGMGLDAAQLQRALRVLGMTTVNDWLALSEEQFYQRVLQHNALAFFVPQLVPQRDAHGFTTAYRAIREQLLAEDPRGLVGYIFNQGSLPRRGEPVMERVGSLHERARKAYCKKFLLDVFQEDLPFGVAILEGGELVAQYPADSQHPQFLISLLIDDVAAVYKDADGTVHIPIKHAAWIEYHA